MAPENNKTITLYEEAKAGLGSLVPQTATVFIGFAVMLLVTGGAPSGFVVGLSFCLGTAFVAWSEQKRIKKITKPMQAIAPEISTSKIYRESQSNDNPVVSYSGFIDVGITHSDINYSGMGDYCAADKVFGVKVEDDSECRKRVLNAIREMQIQKIKKAINQHLIREKDSIRAGSNSFLLAKFSELEGEINGIFEEFTILTNLIVEKEKIVKDIQDPRTRRVMLKELDKDYTSFAEFQEKLLDKFLQIASEDF